jgi:hypothetical protein
MNFKAYKRPDRQRVVIFADHPKHLDPAKAFEMHLAALRSAGNLPE